MNVLVFGCGGRGKTYARYAAEHGLRIVAAADPRQDRLDAFGAEFGLPQDALYTDWQQALNEQSALALINTTPDRVHYTTTMAALKKGLHVLLEKPISPDKQECIDIINFAEQQQLLVMVCHVLRYAPFFEKLHQLIQEGAIGQLTNLVMTENVASWHYAHSFVRGIWNREDQASPFILAKSCHDLDLIVYLTGKNCRSVMSEGLLGHFTAENAPPGAPAFCLDGCPHERSCPYFAPRLYLKPISYVGWPANVISTDTSYAQRFEALRSGPYGRCVYHCDNDVNDRQSALFMLEDGLLASFNMTAFSSENTRTLRIYGTKGDIRGHLDKGEIEVNQFLDQQRQQITIQTETLISGHGGGDTRLLGDFAAALRGQTQGVKTSARVSLQSHLMAFAAEESRRSGKRVMIGGA